MRQAWHWRGVSFDNALTGQHYEVNGSIFDGCRFFDSRGWAYDGKVGTPIRGEHYIINCHAENKLYAYPAATLVRNSTARQISGDVLQNVQCAINVTLDTIDGTIVGHHTDIYQVLGKSDNVILYGVKATNMHQTQGWMMESFIGRDVPNITEPFDPNYTVKNMALVDVDLDGKLDNAFSHMMGYFDNVLFRNVKMPNQRILVRDQFDLGGTRNVVYQNCDLQPGSTLQNPPEAA